MNLILKKFAHYEILVHEKTGEIIAEGYNIPMEEVMETLNCNIRVEEVKSTVVFE